MSVGDSTEGAGDSAGVPQVIAVVRGLVQGVNFRHYTRQRARALGLTGHVRNRADGTVCVVAQGNRDALAQLLAWLQHGPDSAEVTGVDVMWETVGERAVGFEVVY